MNSCYTCILFAFILLLSHSASAYRTLPYLYPYSYDAVQQAAPSAQTVVVVPNDDDNVWPQYSVPSVNQVPDDRIRRGWGNGRRRRSITSGQ